MPLAQEIVHGKFLSYYPLKQELKHPHQFLQCGMRFIFILLSIKTRIETQTFPRDN